ncbi:UNVERIFIED_CONTAM: hypothetical protein FKN15_027212 [Acipenser sinensis]
MIRDTRLQNKHKTLNSRSKQSSFPSINHNKRNRLWRHVPLKYPQPRPLR